jgi:hypothetical protein
MSDVVMILIGAFAGAVAFGIARSLRRRIQPRARTVEEPNSHYTAPGVRVRETEARWKSIALDRVHEINREEVKRLLEKVEALGVESLGPRDRNFLNHLADLFGSPAAEPPATGIAPPLKEATT